jgi:hypothetical protein
LKNPITKNWAGGVAQSERPEFKPQYPTKQNKTTTTTTEHHTEFNTPLYSY